MAFQLVRLLCIFSFALLAGCGKREKGEAEKKSRPLPRSAYQLEEVVSFGAQGQAEKYKQGGWGDTEDEGTWTNGYSARLRLALQEANEPLRLQMKLAGFTNPPGLPYQSVEVFANDERIADWQVSDPADFLAIIPKDLVEHERLIIELRMPLATSPQAIGIGEDQRTLGIFCYAFVLTKTTAELVREEAAKRKEDPRAGAGAGYQPGTLIYLGAGAGGTRYKTYGWHTAEKNFTWIGTGPAALELLLRPEERPLRFRMRLAGMVVPNILPVQPTQVLVNGEKIADWPVAELAEHSAVIPPDIAADSGWLKIELRAPAAASPKDLQLGDDTRPLGLRCETFVIEPISWQEYESIPKRPRKPRPRPSASP